MSELSFSDLEEILRHRLVRGVNSEKMQNWLLSEVKLTYQKGLYIAQSQEIAAQNLNELKSNPLCGAESGNQSDEGRSHMI